MGSIVRMLERGLIGVLVIVMCIVSMIMSWSDFDALSRMSVYVGLYVVSFVAYRACFGVVLYKLRLLNEAIRLGVFCPEDIKSHAPVVKVDNGRLFKNKHYRIQVTERLIRILKSLACCGKKIGRVASSYAAFHIDHPLVLIELVVAMQGSDAAVEVFRRRLLQLPTIDNDWLVSFFKEGLKKHDFLLADNDEYFIALCQKIRRVCEAYGDKDKAQTIIKDALETLIYKYHSSKSDVDSVKSKIQVAMIVYQPMNESDSACVLDWSV